MIYLRDMEFNKVQELMETVRNIHKERRRLEIMLRIIDGVLYNHLEIDLQRTDDLEYFRSLGYTVIEDFCRIFIQLKNEQKQSQREEI